MQKRIAMKIVNQRYASLDYDSKVWIPPPHNMTTLINDASQVNSETSKLYVMDRIPPITANEFHSRKSSGQVRTIENKD